MPRRVSLPGASELFRRTEAPPSVQPGAKTPPTPGPASPSTGDEPTLEPSSPASAAPGAPAEAAHTGRVRHDEKMTVYVSAAELVALEQARLTLRTDHGLKVDRGRIVRAAVAMALADRAARGPDADLAQQLREQ